MLSVTACKLYSVYKRQILIKVVYGSARCAAIDAAERAQHWDAGVKTTVSRSAVSRDFTSLVGGTMVAPGYLRQLYPTRE